MKMILIVFGLLLATSALADSARIHSITPTFIKFEDGRVGFLDEIDNEVLNKLKPGNLINFTLDQENILEDVMIDSSLEMSLPLPDAQAAEDYIPTILPDYTYATNLLHTFRYPSLNEAQCYDKAHVWVYEADYFYRAKLQKMWLFFSDHYIERYRFKWWFHVAPFARVRMKGVVQERIMDRSFYQYPLKLKLWTDMFMENKAACKEVTFYTDYSQHPNEDDCYVIRSTPFYWQPRDLEKLAERGTKKDQYLRWEIIHAYKKGFGLDTSMPGATLK